MIRLTRVKQKAATPNLLINNSTKDDVDMLVPLRYTQANFQPTLRTTRNLSQNPHLLESQLQIHLPLPCPL